VRPSGENPRAEAETRVAPAPRDRIPRSRRGEPDSPEPDALRPLARALVDLAVALGHEDEEDE